MCFLASPVVCVRGFTGARPSGRKVRYSFSCLFGVSGHRRRRSLAGPGRSWDLRTRSLDLVARSLRREGRLVFYTRAGHANTEICDQFRTQAVGSRGDFDDEDVRRHGPANAASRSAVMFFIFEAEAFFGSSIVVQGLPVLREEEHITPMSDYACRGLALSDVFDAEQTQMGLRCFNQCKDPQYLCQGSHKKSRESFGKHEGGVPGIPGSLIHPGLLYSGSSCAKAEEGSQR